VVDEPLKRSYTLAVTFQGDTRLRSSSKPFPGFDHIYLFSSTGSDREFVGDLNLAEHEEFSVLRGESLPATPIEISWAMGRSQPSDVIWTTLAVPVILSAKVISIMKAGDFAGWSTYPVLVKSKDGEVIDGYVGLSVTGRCGTIDDSRCECVAREFPGGVFPMYRGLYFDDSQWDGSDIFCSENESGYIFVTHDVKSAFEHARIRNVLFQPVSEIERSTL